MNLLFSRQLRADAKCNLFNKESRATERFSVALNFFNRVDVVIFRNTPYQHKPSEESSSFAFSRISSLAFSLSTPLIVQPAALM